MLRHLLGLLPEQKIQQHLLADEGEHVIDIVEHHWVAYIRGIVFLLGGVVALVVAVIGPIELGWFFLLVGFGLLLFGGYRMMREHMDLFVITNMRVFRASGVFTQKVATMPIARILDITVNKPFIGRILGYGHFVFESAAQEQGLRDIRAIGDPDARNLTIQSVVQRSGLRGPKQGI
ncbi:PH domain-containing protein [Solicola gregarius]|uniref:PH domain-containing protein n=1 Tax=Solicola gregarius TaxID=2908642 RepID=A0AA46YLT9_9ACTN|nr:PH domain-containing protein [Solicola gregarius]UYM05924.1 PH domain-containing protein [Solicola gregarius]